MMTFLSAAFFVLGTIVASFVGVVVARLNTGQSFLRGRSQCDACNAPLTAMALVPIISYFFSRGRAQCCGARISFFAPLSEILLGGLFILAYLALGISWALLFMLGALGLLLALVLYDLAHQILPPVVLASFVMMSAGAGFLTAPSLTLWYANVLSAACMAAALGAIHFLSRGRAMGLADTPLVFGLGLLTGPAAFSGFLFSFWIGAGIGIVLLAQRPRGSRMGVEVPFAPFLAAGFLLAYFTQWNIFTLIALLGV